MSDRVQQRLGVQHLDTIGRVGRAALVSDVEWVRQVAHLEDRMMRGIDIRGFSMAEEEQAKSGNGSP